MIVTNRCVGQFDQMEIFHKVWKLFRDQIFLDINIQWKRVLTRDIGDAQGIIIIDMKYDS